jgi:hypothetical protein
MKSLLLLLVVASARLASGQAASSKPENLLHTQTRFTLQVPAPYREAAPLFGPLGERAWAGTHWDPKFIFPLPAKDLEGAVFTVKHGPFRAVWVNTAFDLAGRHFQYVYFLPDVMVTTIDVRFEPVKVDSTRVDVVYTRTSLTEAGNEPVAAMTEGDRGAGADWQRAIDGHFAKPKPVAPR